MRITETMPAGRIIQVFAKVRSRIYPRSQTESRLASFGENYAPSPARREQLQLFQTGCFKFNLLYYILPGGSALPVPSLSLDLNCKTRF